MPLGTQFVKYGDGVGHAALEGIIGIHQKQATCGEHLRIFAESRQFVWEGHDPAVRMGTHHGDAVHLTGEHVAGAVATADDGGTSAIDACVRSLGTAQAEFHHHAAAGSLYHAAGLGGNQGLMIDDI